MSSGGNLSEMLHSAGGVDAAVDLITWVAVHNPEPIGTDAGFYGEIKSGVAAGVVTEEIGVQSLPDL